LAEILVKNGDLDGSITEYKKAIQIDPNFANLHQKLGQVFEKVESRSGAVV
jgi:cytochrome c-type biogenesis protein CcmH/NrfG